MCMRKTRTPCHGCEGRILGGVRSSSSETQMPSPKVYSERQDKVKGVRGTDMGWYGNKGRPIDSRDGDGFIVTPLGIIKAYAYRDSVSPERMTQRLQSKSVERSLAGEDPCIYDWHVLADFIYNGINYDRSWSFIDRLPTGRGITRLAVNWQKSVINGLKDNSGNR